MEQQTQTVQRSITPITPITPMTSNPTENGRRCCRCLEVLPVSAFYRGNIKAQGYCRSCVRDYSREWMREKYQRDLEAKAQKNPERYKLCECGDYFTAPKDPRCYRETCRACSGFTTSKYREQI